MISTAQTECNGLSSITQCDIFENVYRLITRSVRKWAKKERLTDDTLLLVIDDLAAGRSVSDLGAGLFKVRMARSGQGKRGGYRTLIVYRAEDRAIVVYGFAKSETDNIDDDDLALFKKLAKDLLALTDVEIDKAIQNQILFVLTKQE